MRKLVCIIIALFAMGFFLPGAVPRRIHRDRRTARDRIPVWMGRREVSNLRRTRSMPRAE
jgi:pilus assembly protein TadC